MECYSAVKKEHIWVSPNEVDETRAYYTGWSQKEKNKHHLLMHIYYNLEGWYWCSYMQGSNGDADIGNRLTDTEWGGIGWDDLRE